MSRCGEHFAPEAKLVSLPGKEISLIFHCQFRQHCQKQKKRFSFCCYRCAFMISHVQFFATPWTIAHQAPLHEIFQARILGWFAISCFRGSSHPRDKTQVSCVSCISRCILLPLRHLGSPLLLLVSNCKKHCCSVTDWNQKGWGLRGKQLLLGFGGPYSVAWWGSRFSLCHYVTMTSWDVA